MLVNVDHYIDACAPEIGRQTMAAIIRVESGGNPWAVGDNTQRPTGGRQPRSYGEAVELARKRIAAGHSVDLGFAQVNSKNLGWLGLTVEQVLEPCTNLRAASHILRHFFVLAAQKYGYTHLTLLHALSAYNTGSFHAGGRYVSKVLAAARGTGSVGLRVPIRPSGGTGGPIEVGRDDSDSSWRVF